MISRCARWLGDWDVRNAAGRVVGTNTIALCRQWHQTWMDSSGSLLELDGSLVDGAMVLASAASESPRNCITWRVLPDGRVRQLWETSSDSGATWKTSFDGYYERKGK